LRQTQKEQQNIVKQRAAPSLGRAAFSFFMAQKRPAGRKTMA
jgi:hypothetical protein